MLARIAVTVAVALFVARTALAQWVMTEEAKLGSDATPGDKFGYAVSVSGDTAVIGATGYDELPTLEMGSAHVFVRSGTNWTEQAKLTPSDAEPFELFGNSVSLAGDTAVVGAFWDDPEFFARAGSAYVFVRSGTNWTELARLTATDPSTDDYFGCSVSLSGDTLVVGAYSDNHAGGADAGSAYVFVSSGTSWTEQAQLAASDATASDQFGYSVAIHGETIAVGAPGNSPGGAAYVFVRSGTAWTEQAKLTASDAAGGDSFGYSVSLSGDSVVVGAYRDDLAGGTNAGSAYVFVRSGSTWIEQAKLTASDPAASDHFGGSTSLLGDTLVVGARYDDHVAGADAGSAYLFVRSGATWTEQAKVTASDAAADDSFGVSVSLSGDTAVVGALWDDHTVGTDAGSAYVFQLTPGSETYCTAGTSASGCQALLSASGTASATATSGFMLSAATVEGQKDGLFFFGTNGQQANPWGNGTSYQCVVPPVVRTNLLTGTGTNGLCDGALGLDLNTVWTNQPAKNPGAGSTVQAQLWYRDPLSTSNQTTSLSDAVEFGVAP